MPVAVHPFCAVPGCPERAHRRGRCLQHGAAIERQRPNHDFRLLYMRMKWRHPVYGMRSIVLREEPLCTECLAEGHVRVSTDVHHKQKATVENFYERSNLTALCGPHHAAHTAKGE